MSFFPELPNLSLDDLYTSSGVPLREIYTRFRPGDVATVRDPRVSDGGGGGTQPQPQPPAQTLPTDVRPGDLIRAEDWNAMLARLRALEAAVAALQKTPPPTSGGAGGGGIPPAKERDPRLFEKFMAQPEIMRAVVNDPTIREKILSNPDVTKAIKEQPELFTDMLAEMGPAVAEATHGAATERASAVTEAAGVAEKPAATTRRSTRRTVAPSG